MPCDARNGEIENHGIKKVREPRPTRFERIRPYLFVNSSILEHDNVVDVRRDEIGQLVSDQHTCFLLERAIQTLFKQVFGHVGVDGLRAPRKNETQNEMGRPNQWKR